VIVTLTAEAEADLEAIGDYIAQDNPERAVSFVEEIAERCLRLGQAPNAYALVPRLAHLGIRKRTFGNYLIFYRVLRDQVQVLHVLNSARDYEAILLADSS
jgi:plasmid stabilization system protein ParE